MKNYQSMVEANKKSSKRKTDLAKETILKMLDENVFISIAELTRRTGCSRSFFYNNKEVSDLLKRAMEQQQGKILRSRKVALDTAVGKQVQRLEKKVERLYEDNQKLQEENEKLKKVIHNYEKDILGDW